MSRGNSSPSPQWPEEDCSMFAGSLETIIRSPDRPGPLGQHEDLAIVRHAEWNRRRSSLPRPRPTHERRRDCSRAGAPDAPVHPLFEGILSRDARSGRPSRLGDHASPLHPQAARAGPSARRTCASGPGPGVPSQSATSRCSSSAPSSTVDVSADKPDAWALNLTASTEARLQELLCSFWRASGVRARSARRTDFGSAFQA